MKLAIMQPYFLPYIGYFQLIKAVDKFIVFDDVNYIKKGWINRNRILVNGNEFTFTVPLEKASQNKQIREINLLSDNIWKGRLLETFDQTYKKAPMYLSVFPILEEIVEVRDRNLSAFVSNSILQICKYLEISLQLELSSLKYETALLKGQDKILRICEIEKADIYINPEGGINLYQKQVFEKQNIKLQFLRSRPVIYNRFNEKSLPFLSIIDVMMFNDKNMILDFLKEFELV